MALPAASGAGSGYWHTSGNQILDSAAYSLTNTWSGGFQAQIVLTNTGAAPIISHPEQHFLPELQTLTHPGGAAASPSSGSTPSLNCIYMDSLLRVRACKRRTAIGYPQVQRASTTLRAPVPAARPNTS